MQDLKKITIVLPADLLEMAIIATGKGITSTIREALESLAAVHAFEDAPSSWQSETIDRRRSASARLALRNYRGLR